MRRPLHLAVPLLIAPIGCAAPSSDTDIAEPSAETQQWARQRDCGFNGAMGFGGGQRARPGDDVRACELPTAEQVELVCEAHEAAPIPGTEGHDPDFPDDPRYELPEYTVSELNCDFTDPEHSSAACSFELAVGKNPPRSAKAALTYRFYARGGVLTFGYGTMWQTSASCLPDTEVERAG